MRCFCWDEDCSVNNIFLLLWGLFFIYLNGNTLANLFFLWCLFHYFEINFNFKTFLLVFWTQLSIQFIPSIAEWLISVLFLLNDHLRMVNSYSAHLLGYILPIQFIPSILNNFLEILTGLFRSLFKIFTSSSNIQLLYRYYL